jgi:hypothetical protein
MVLRIARFTDLSTIAKIFGAGFYDEEVVGGLLHPHRELYPHDYLTWWIRAVRAGYWDYSNVYVLSYRLEEGTGKEIVMGAAQWQRHGRGWERFWRVGGWWDPSKSSVWAGSY